MADRDITVGLRTTGASRTAADIQSVENAMEDLGNQAPRTAAQIDEVGDATRQLGTSSAYNKGGANAGTAVLEVSRAFEDLQYGIRGVLNNIPSLIFALGGSAGLAGVISVAAVAGTALWTKFSGGAKKAKEDTGDLMETFKQLVEVYGKLDQTNAEDRAKAAEAAAKGLQSAINSISLGQLITGNRAGLSAAREVAAASLQLAKDRNRLAEVEKATTLASGQDAVRLAKEREAILTRILASERAITEAGRQRELSIATDKVAGAQAKVDATKGPADLLGVQAADLQRSFRELSAEADRLRDARFTEINAINDKIAAEKAALTKRLEDASLTGIDPTGLILASEAIVNGLLKARAPLTDLNSDKVRPEQELRAQAEVAAAALKELEPKLAASAEAQREAARAMTEATLALSNLRQSQDVSRQSEEELKAAEQIGRVGADVTQAARDAIAAILANAQQQGRAPNAGENEAIGRAQQLLNDTTPDAQQGGQLAGILQSLANNITAKDRVLSGGIERLISTTKTLAGKYEGLQERVKAVQNQVNQLK